jgi:hypothetical protein
MSGELRTAGLTPENSSRRKALTLDATRHSRKAQGDSRVAYSPRLRHRETRGDHEVALLPV